MRAEVVLTGLGVPEGPVVHADGRVSFTEQVRGRVSCWDGARCGVVAITGGAPNSHAAGADGQLYVAQNGGVVGSWRSPDPRPPGVQRVGVDGAVTTVATRAGGVALLAPNDLVFAPDGSLALTDPGHPYDPVRRGPGGRVLRLDAAGGSVLAEPGAVYCNGLAFDPAGRLVWVQSYDRRVCRLDASGEVVVLAELPEGHVPDGIAIATDGRIFIATCGSHGVTVVGPDGQLLDHLLLDGRANATNAAFAADGALWVTDFGMDWADREGAGRLWRLPTDALGLPLVLGSLPAPEPGSSERLHHAP